MDEEESEEQWRKMRHEREMFLKGTVDNDLYNEDEDDDLIGKLRVDNKINIEQSSVQHTTSTEEQTYTLTVII